MINSKNNPVEWALLIIQMQDAQESLSDLIQNMSETGKIDEVEFQIEIIHIYHHLNTAWNSRNRDREPTDGDFETEEKFPKDIDLSNFQRASRAKTARGDIE